MFIRFLNKMLLPSIFRNFPTEFTRDNASQQSSFTQREAKLPVLTEPAPANQQPTSLSTSQPQHATQTMTKTRRIALIFALCFFGGILLKLYQDRNPTTAELRRTMSSSVRSSCLDRAHQTAAPHSATPQQINRYCDCVTSRALDPLSDIELREAAARGAHPSPEDLTRIHSIAQVCSAEVSELK